MLHPPAHWGKGITAMLYAFMDDSGTHGGSNVVALAGFVGSEETWIEVDNRWRGILDNAKWPSRLSEFHMYDCVHGDAEFLDGRWNFAERLMLYGELKSLLSSSRLIPVGASIISACLDRISENDLKVLAAENVRLGTPLDVVFHALVQQLIAVTLTIDRSETIGIVFDNATKAREATFSEMCDHYMNEFYLGSAFTGYGFADSKKIPPIQAADLIAYGTFRLAQDRYYPETSEPYFPVVPIFWDMLTTFAQSPETSPYGTVFDDKSLSQLVDKVKRGEMLPKRKG